MSRWLRWQRSLVFPRHLRRALPNAGDDVPGIERCWHRITESGMGTVESWFLPGDGVSPQTPGPVVLFAHGNGELIDDWPHALDPYRKMGVSVLLPEYRGYGRSGGRPSEHGITDDLVRILEEVIARPDVDPDRVVFHGRSIGGGVACSLTRRVKPRALVLASTFTSLADVRWWFPRPLVLDRFENLEVVGALDRPVCVVHGRQDTLIPVAHAQRLAARARDAQLLLYDAGHNDCLPGDPAQWTELRTFLGAASVVESS